MANIENRYIAVTHGAHIQVWKTPNHLVREFAPFNLHRTYTGHHDDVLSIQWSPDSKYVIEHSKFIYLLADFLWYRTFITTSRDMTARLFTLNPLEGFRPKTFAGHRDAVLAAYFSADGTSVSGRPIVPSYTLLRLHPFLDIYSQQGWRRVHLESKRCVR